MKNCIVQFHVPASSYQEPDYNHIGVNEKLLPLSIKSVKMYAEKCEVDYHLVQDKKIDWKHPTFERFDLFFNQEWFEKYTNILYLDTDLIVWPNAPDIFKMYPDTESFKVCEDRISKRRTPAWHKKHVKDTVLDEFDGTTLQNSRFNAGVFMLNKKSAEQISKFLDYKNIDIDDNSLLIYALLKSKASVTKMDWKFNKKNGVNSYFGHAFGQQKFHNKNYPLLDKATQLFSTS